MKQTGRFILCVIWVGVALLSRGYADQNRSSLKIDQLVTAKLDELGIPSSDLCSDAVFLRRVYLDMIGTLPTAKESRQFLASNKANKRTVLIDELFDRPEFADYWALKWCDILRVKAEFPSKLWPNAVQAYYRWVRTSLFNNMPYDQFAEALLTSSGSNFRVAPVNFYRAMPKREPKEIAGIVALTFMGMRVDHWSEEKIMGMAAFFGQIGYKGTAEWKEEIVYHDPSITFFYPEGTKPVEAVLPNGSPVKFAPYTDPRTVFSAWLLDSKTFSDNIVNRIWYWLLGRGIIHEPDDIREDNPAQNGALIAYLSKELVDHDYDLRHIYRIILNSKTYQRSSVHNEGNLSDKSNFSHYYVRRLGAEVLVDAICQITKTTESYSSDIPEPFTFIPKNKRSITLSDGSITSPFLDLYGRPPRDTGYEAERNNIPSSAQKLHLLNSTHIQTKILNNKVLLGMTQKRGQGRRKSKKQNMQITWEDPDKVIERMYLTILSRYPADQEANLALDYIRESGLSRYEASVDLVWALLNTKEFVFKH